ncbi:MAG: phospho-N-acetylmuramoyl-pentapeptide-transferase [Lachnospiraceae bacterium]|nr:phospho-N-acetylmuramoyl-pentapeptide-transferase [Lachnospiraceae bacterium]
MSRICIISVIVSFAISAAFGPIMIPLLKRIKCGQTVRDDGPQTHLKKTGTPTMGGVLILLGVMAASYVYIEKFPVRDLAKIIPVLFLTFGFGLIGLLDDYIKVVCKQSEGLKPWQKFGAQLFVTGFFAYYLEQYTMLSLALKLPFFQDRYLDLGAWNILFLFLIVLGTANGTNFTDGLDGLAGSVTLMVAVFFAVVAIGMGNGIAPICCAVAGALMGFLLFNVYPATVFMGDTGSLALGGFVAACAYVLEIPTFIGMVGFVYLVEVLSVMAQVVWFKLTGGRRLLKMAPLHHHFELCGWSETRIVTLFTVVTALLCMLSFWGL